MVVPAAVNASNQLPGIAGGAAFTYDATGDLTSDGTRTDTYDAEGDGHILTATGPGLVASTRYDPFGRRYSKTVNGVTTVYDDDPEGRVIADYDGSGHVLRLYGYLGKATAPAVVMTPTGAMNGDNPVMSLVYNHVDRLGSVVATSASGTLADSFSYMPFGESPGDPELTGTEFGFDGYQFDAETGLYHTQNRYYDPRLGPFLSPDPLGQAAGRNVYAYVENDPLNNVDPDGTQAIPGFFIGAAAGGSAGYVERLGHSAPIRYPAPPLPAVAQVAYPMPDGSAPPQPPTIAAILANRGLLSGPALDRVRRLEGETGERVDRIAAKLGLVADRDLAEAYAALLGTPVLEAADFPAEPVAAGRLTATFLRHARVIPLAKTDAALRVTKAEHQATVGSLATSRPMWHSAAMASVEKLSVALTPEMVAEMRAAVEGGDYGSVSEVVRDALRDWRLRRKIETLEAEELRRLVQEGIDSGPGLAADAVFARLRARFGQPPTK